MEFFYPNPNNQMWYIFGLLFYGDAERLVDRTSKSFRLPDIKKLLKEHGIAIFDTATAVCRLNDNASDKDLQIVEKTDLPSLLAQIPQCRDIVCTGQKSFSVLTEDYGIAIPAMGEHNDFTLASRPMHLWRMPSSSRAYPMKLEDKAEYYRKMLTAIGIMS